MFHNEDTPVAGVSYHREAFDDFVDAARASKAAKHPYGVSIVRDPANKHDPNALIVSGFWGSKRKQERKLGYVDKDTARDIAQWPDDMPLAGELVSVTINNASGSINVYIYILVPGLKSGYWNDKPEHPFMTLAQQKAI